MGRADVIHGECQLLLRQKILLVDDENLGFIEEIVRPDTISKIVSIFLRIREPDR